MAIHSSTRANSSSRSVMWLPASWTMGLMTIFLSITMFVGHSVPENYMVCNASTAVAAPVLSGSLCITTGIKHNCGRWSWSSVGKARCAQQRSGCCMLLTRLGLSMLCPAAALDPCATVMPCRTNLSCAHDTTVLQRQLHGLGSQDHHLPRAVLHRCNLRLGQPSTAVLDGHQHSECGLVAVTYSADDLPASRLGHCWVAACPVIDTGLKCVITYVVNSCSCHTSRRISPGFVPHADEEAVWSGLC